jgi:hypothetical protein
MDFYQPGMDARLLVFSPDCSAPHDLLAVQVISGKEKGRLSFSE